MTPKERYDERKRLKADRLHRAEVEAAAHRQQGDDGTAMMKALMHSFERIADVMELWADMQSEPPKGGE